MHLGIQCGGSCILANSYRPRSESRVKGSCIGPKRSYERGTSVVYPSGRPMPVYQLCQMSGHTSSIKWSLPCRPSPCIYCSSP